MGQRFSDFGRVSFEFKGNSDGATPGILYERDADKGIIRITNNTPATIDIRYADLDARFGTRMAFNGVGIARIAPGRWIEIYEAPARGLTLNRDTW